MASEGLRALNPNRVNQMGQGPFNSVGTASPLISAGTYSAPRSPGSQSHYGMGSQFPTMVLSPQTAYAEERVPSDLWQNRVDEASEPYDDPEEDDDAFEQRVIRNPLQSRTGTDFAGEIPDTAFTQFHSEQAHATVDASHRLRAAQEAHHHAQRELDEAMHHHHVHHRHMQAHGMDQLLHNRHPETDPDRRYQYEHPGHPVLKDGAGIQEVEPYPFWVGAGTPAARLEPTWIGGEWYLVAPVDFKGLENSEKTHGFSKEMQNHQLRVVDDAVHHLESQGTLPTLPPPRHWKEHKDCPIA